jgi:hypothetical protein
MQTAIVLSSALQTPQNTGLSQPACNNTGWIIQLQYQPDLGGLAQTQIQVGGVNSIGFWANANTSIQVSVPGCAAQINVPCPPLIQWAVFGVRSPGIPFQ